MKPMIAKQERHGWPSQPQPDPKPREPEPWSLELLVGVNRVHHHSLSPDGKQVCFIWDREGNSDLWLMPIDGSGWPVRLTFDRPARPYWADAQPHWSPDGARLSYASRNEVWIVPAAGGRARKLTDYGHDAGAPIFGPDGRRLYFVSKRRVFGNLCSTTPEGDWPVALTRFEADVSDPRPAPSGSAVAFVYHPRNDLNRSEICIVPASGGEARHLTGAPQVWDLHPRWSPDGSRIAFTSNRSGWRELYLLDPASGETAGLTQGQADVQGFGWSPDGKHIAYVADREGVGDLFLVSLESGQARPLRAASGWHAFPQWSPDGTWLTVEFEGPQFSPDVWRIDIGSDTARPLTHSLPPTLQAAGLQAPQCVRYPSTGGTSIPALLFRPASASAARPCPAIVYPHGGPTGEYGLQWDLMSQWLVAKGYAVLAPNYRGSTGYGIGHQHALHGRWGIVDTEDMLAAADYLGGLGWVDGSRLGIVGFSYGSYLALLALARDPAPSPKYRCAVCAYGDCDILTSWAEGDRIGRDDLERQMRHPSDNRAGYQAGSPVQDVDKIRAPVLIFHGSLDERVHPLQSEEVVEALKRCGKTYEYIVYEGEGHGFLHTGNLLHFYATLQRFLDWYLM